MLLLATLLWCVCFCVCEEIKHVDILVWHCAILIYVHTHISLCVQAVVMTVQLVALLWKWHGPAKLISLLSEFNGPALPSYLKQNIPLSTSTPPSPHQEGGRKREWGWRCSETKKAAFLSPVNSANELRLAPLLWSLAGPTSVHKLPSKRDGCDTIV